MKLIGIYNGDQTPVRVGVYQRKYVSSWLYCFWDGERWFCGSNYTSIAAHFSGGRSSQQNLPWRGVEK